MGFFKIGHVLFAVALTFLLLKRCGELKIDWFKTCIPLIIWGLYVLGRVASYFLLYRKK